MDKIILNGTYGYKNYITDDEKNQLLKWVKDNDEKFKKNEEGRKFIIVSDIDNSPVELIETLRKRIIDLENISDWKIEPLFKDYIGINTKGGSIPSHTDPNDGEYIHTRYNILLSYPDEGGESLYGTYINKLEENMIWKCIAGKVLHGSKPVLSDKPRITLSLGFLTKNKKIV